MIMPRLSFEEPKGGPLAKAARAEQDDDQPTDQDDGLEVDHGDHDDDQPAERLSELFVEEPADEPGRHRRPANRDTVLVVLKAATVAVVLALTGAVILLATAGGSEQDARSPSVPDIPTSHEPSAGPTTTPLGAMIAPQVHTQTAAIVPTLPTVTQPTVPTDDGPPGRGDDEFVRVGEPCDTPGAYAFTQSFEPVVCDTRGEGNRLAWRRIFR
jgi:hypothetical protein